jgi:hypothetical protein
MQANHVTHHQRITLNLILVIDKRGQCWFGQTWGSANRR